MRQKYTVEILAPGTSQSWRMRKPGGVPFTARSRWVIFLKDPMPGRIIDVLIADWYADCFWQLVGEERYWARRRRLRGKRDARVPDRADMLARVVSVSRFRGVSWGRDWHGRTIGRLTEDEAVSIAARLEDGRTVAV